MQRSATNSGPFLDYTASKDDNIEIEVLAGTGKTTVMVQIVQVFTGRGLNDLSFAFAERDNEALDLVLPHLCQKQGNARPLRRYDRAGSCPICHKGVPVPD